MGISWESRRNAGAMIRLAWASPSAIDSADSRFWARWGPEAWVMSIARATRSCSARLRSRCCRHGGRTIPRGSADSSRRRVPPQASATRTSSRSTMSACMKDVRSSSPSCLQGETLRECLRGRALPPSKSVEYAIHIASGLAAGHERGITHRDIKPENLFVTRDGLVKILDFGLAIQSEPGSSPSRRRQRSPSTAASAASIAGTAIYMSPEQARGLRADHRSDIFSLASVLYEMLTGAPPFRRETAADTISAILSEEPQELTAVAGVTPALERIVRHCLEKRPEDRFQNARDLIFALQSLSHPSSPERRPRRSSHAGAAESARMARPRRCACRRGRRISRRVCASASPHRPRRCRASVV